MIRFFPKSLAGQMIILTLIAIFFAQMFGFWIFADERRLALQSAIHQQALTHSSSIVQVLENTPVEYQAKIVEASNTENFHLSIDNRSTVKHNRTRYMERALTIQLQEMLEIDQNDIRLKLHRDGKNWLRWRAWKQHFEHLDDGDWDDRYDQSRHNESDGDHDIEEEINDDDVKDRNREDKHKLTWAHRPQGFPPELTIAIKLSSGKWLNVKNYAPPPSPLWALPSLMAMLLSAITLILIVIFMMRRVTKPMAALALAAERLGRGDTYERLPPMGPQDVRKATDAFNLMQERLDRFVKDRTNMLAAISHDLRTPITSLRIQAEFIEDEELREKILAALSEMQAMTEATLSFAKQEANDETTSAANIHALLDSIVLDFQDMGKRAELSGPDDLIINCRPIALKRALRNLIENAIKYGDQAQVDLSSTKEHILIDIQDEGPGIPTDMMDQVFEPFFRLDKARNLEDGSVGLGLAIARSIIQSHGGEISLENGTAKGLKILVKLPILS